MFKKSAKSDRTRRRLLDAALEAFRSQGFDAATIRSIASRAGIAPGGVYYYYDSKEAIVLDFYRLASDELEAAVGQVLAKPGSLDDTLRRALHAKLDYFAPNRTVLRALLRNGADPAYPLSPFSEATRDMRETDIARFARLLEVTGTRVGADLAPHLPSILWLYHMGLILFWVTDDSPGQKRTRHLVDRSAGVVAGLVKLAGLPLTRPLRKPLVDLIAIVKGAEA